jgi:hypothetical protein
MINFQLITQVNENRSIIVIKKQDLKLVFGEAYF